jgi:hypothetical protein
MRELMTMAVARVMRRWLQFRVERGAEMDHLHLSINERQRRDDSQGILLVAQVTDNADPEFAAHWPVPEGGGGALHHYANFLAQGCAQLFGGLRLQHDQAMRELQRFASLGRLADVAVHVGARERDDQWLFPWEGLDRRMAAAGMEGQHDLRT